MNLSILWAATPPIPVHVVVAVLALLLGTIQLARPKGTRSHRIFGWCWVVLMAVVATTGLFINDLKVIGNFSPIHLLSVFTLMMLLYAVISVKRGDIRAHKIAMTMIFSFALVVTGLLTLLPGRLMHDVLFTPVNQASDS